MFRNIFKDLPFFDKDEGKSVIDRLNMGRLYIFNIFGCVGVLLLALFLRLTGLHILPAGYQNSALPVFAGIMALSAAAVFFTTRTHSTELFDKVCYAYLFVFSAAMFSFAFKTQYTSVALVCAWGIMLVIGCLPVIRPDIFAIIWVTELIPVVILAVVRHFSAESVTAVVIISLMSFMLSVVLYGNTLRKLDYKLRLDSAVSEAETDPMTMLLNRRGLDRRTENAWPYCVRQRLGVAVMMIDIDNFKKFNDTYGHAAGDDCIRKVTAASRKNVKRRTDYAARVGGEEFLVMLSGVDPKNAVKWALELKRTIDALKIPHAASNFSPYVSVSMGVACAEASDEISFESLREEADKSLDEAKYNGRACVYYHHKAFGKASVTAKTGTSEQL